MIIQLLDLNNKIFNNFYKKADKLAGKILRIYNEDLTPNRSREDFLGQEDKLFHIPQLVCQEDYPNLNLLLEQWNNIEQVYFVHVFKNCPTLDNIDDNNPLTINIYSINKNGLLPTVELVSSESIIQKKLMAKGLENLRDVLDNSTESVIGLMFYSIEQPLQKLDMLLRKRWVLPMPDTPLTRSFKAATSRFSKIVLHNDTNLIGECLEPRIVPTIVEKKSCLMKK